ncbi:MAG TPA: amino acid adenylation domain-containing protein [Caldithrix abyssi]|uniref:Amino acid adenylation domain-containing protein n=1 Tax=Caldithrix abyssi TaxID=187145 RepID=A0A7V4UDW8_CALAY|nr:amino acid adenylation domain-containing protein [Caldithrix abyssi]
MNQPKNKNIEAVYPLSPMQQGMLFHSIFDPEAGMYFEQTTFKMKGDLDKAAFERAVAKVIERNPVLRTSFVYKKLEKQLQVVHKTVDIPLVFHDWRSQDKKKQERMLQNLLDEDRRQGFSLNKAPLLRLNVIQMDEDLWQIIWSNHHILMDGWSLPIILKEVFTFYEMYRAGQEMELPRNRPYRDYILWLQKQDMAKAETFWREQLKGFYAPTPLVIKNLAVPEDAADTYPKIHIKLSENVTARLQDIARSNQLTINTVVQGLWSILLSRYSGEEDVVFGATVSGRPPDLPGVETMPGLFINTLPVRAQMNDSTPVIDLLKNLQASTVAQREYEYTPLAEIQRWSDVPANAPLFETLVVFENYPVDKSMNEQKTSLQFLEMQAFERTNYPITFVAAVTDRLALEIAYQNKLFTESTIRRMLGHLQLLAEQIAADPARTIGDLTLLPEEERQQVTEEWNRTKTDFPDSATVHEIFERQVKTHSSKPALQFYDQIFTYRQLDEQINQLANYLLDKGFASEDIAAVYMDRSPEMIIAEFAVMKAGGAFVPIDRNYPPERIRLILEDSGARYVITQKDLLENIKDFAGQALVWENEAENIAAQAITAPAVRVLPENLAYIIYTSGSTGRPKGTLLQHRGAINTAAVISKNFDVAVGKRILQFASIGFDASIAEIFGALLHGASLHLIRYEDILNEDKMLALLREQEISTFILPPSVLAILDNNRLPALKVVGSAGEACTREVVSRWVKGRKFINGYGPTESTVAASLYHIREGQPIGVNVPIGRPIDNVRLYVLDSKLRPQPIGVPGELHIASVGLARGYLNRPELTAEKFIPDPFGPQAGGRLYKTGDLVRWLPDGNLEFLGRIDFQVKIRGFRIELGEIENVLADHPQIRDAVVQAYDQTDGDTTLAAYYVAQDGQNPDPKEIIVYLKEHLPEYMIPGAFIPLEAFPLTSSGKVDRRALPAPDTGDIPAREYVAPRNQMEEILSGIWQQILQKDRVGVTDDFFELGGHSLMATQLMSRVRNAFEVEISLRDFFAQPTIGQLAMQIEQARLKDDTLIAPPIEPLKRDGEIPLSFAQQRLWFLDQLSPDSPFYNIPGAIRLKGKLDKEVLKQSLNEIIRRHETLRTTFDNIRGKPVQVIHDQWHIDIPVEDLSALKEEERESKARRLAEEETAKPFNLKTGPLVRVRLIKLAEDDFVMVFTMHHIISDGWSIGVLIREFGSLYEAYSRGETPSLPELPIQYADFSAWQRNWLQGEVLDKQLTYWKEKIGLNPPVLELPLDYPRPKMQTFNGDALTVTLSPEVQERLKAFSRKEGVTLFMTLLAVFQTMLHRYSGQEDILVGSPIANRTRAETEALIGFFVNTLVLKTHFEDNPDFRSLLKQVRETTLEAYAHQDLPFEQLVEVLQPERDMSHSPLFQVAFILQNVPIQRIELPDLTLAPFNAESKTAKYDLTLTTAETDEGLMCHFEYNTDLFKKSTVERMMRHFQTLLEAVLDNPKQPVGYLPLLSEAEKQLFLGDWNNTRVAYPDAHTVQRLFEEWVERQPDAPAVVFEDAHLTYKELNEHANRLARYLRKKGVGPDILAGISLPASLDVAVAILGILKAGGAFMNIDPAYPPERIRYMMDDSGMAVLITHEELLNILPQTSAVTVCTDRDAEEIAKESDQNPQTLSGPDNLSYVIYTSGSTGKPKGTMLPHRGLCNLSRAQRKAFNITPQSRILQFASLSFDASVWETVMALLNGAALVYADREQLASGQGLLQVFNKQKITTVTLPPSVLAVVPQEPVESLRTIITAGEKCTTDLVQRWGTGRQFVNAYGPTETTVCASMYETDPQEEQAPPIGKPIDNFQLYVLDVYGNLQPAGVPGELHIGGVGLARGYLNRPDLTAEKFIPDPFSGQPGNRLYCSGDLARFLDDGNVEFLGRIDHQVKVRGFRIELGEIESVLGELPNVQDVIVLAREDTPGDKRLVAYLAAEQQEGLDAPTLKKHCQQHLPDYMVPSAFVILEAMPLTPNGKVDRKALPAPEFSRESLSTEYVAPRNENEEKLAAIVTELLNIERAGVHDNFFELGGHSLLATQFMSRIRETFNIELPLRILFEKPTVAELAEALVEAENLPAADVIEKTERDDKSIEELLAGLEQMSDEEAQALLNQELSSEKDSKTDGN